MHSASVQRAGDRVETFVLEIERLGVSDAEVRVASKRRRLLAGDLKHAWTQFDSGQPEVRRVVAQVASGANRDLEHVTLGLGADPLAPVSKEDPLEDPDLPVVLAREIVVMASH